jgi:hypothetical protein
MRYRTQEFVAYLGKRGEWCTSKPKKLFDKLTWYKKPGKGWLLGIRDAVTENGPRSGKGHAHLHDEVDLPNSCHEREDFLISVACMLFHRKAAKRKGFRKWFIGRRAIRIGWVGDTPYRDQESIRKPEFHLEFNVDNGAGPVAEEENEQANGAAGSAGAAAGEEQGAVETAAETATRKAKGKEPMK